MTKLRTLFRDCAVKASSLDDFLNRYYKPERYRGRGEAYAATLRASHQADLERDGCDVISRHDSVTGQTVAYFPKPVRRRQASTARQGERASASRVLPRRNEMKSACSLKRLRARRRENP